VSEDHHAIVWGWKDIARIMGRSVDTAQRRARRNVDPLPVFVEDGRPGAFVGAILAWRARQRVPLWVGDAINCGHLRRTTTEQA
jgi:hypothetical protein